MTRLKIALLAGGDSPEREIALQSAAQIEAALDHSKYDITVVDLHGRDWHHTTPDGRQWQVDKNDFSLTVEVYDRNVVFFVVQRRFDLRGALKRDFPFGRIAARHEGNLQTCHCQGLYMSLYLNSSISCTICAYCRASAWLSSSCSTRLKSLSAAPHSLSR